MAITSSAAASQQQSIRLLIAAENPMDCQLLKATFTRYRSPFIISCASSHSEVMHALATQRPDIALVSESLEDGSMSGFRILGQLRQSSPITRAVLLLKSDREDLVIDAFRAGAKGVFCRTAPIETLRKCVSVVHNGHTWATASQLEAVLHAFASAAPPNVESLHGKKLLTKRENEVAALVAEGYTNREIAQNLGLAEHTVSNYLFRTYEKLGISSRVELVLYSLRTRQL